MAEQINVQPASGSPDSGMSVGLVVGIIVVVLVVLALLFFWPRTGNAPSTEGQPSTDINVNVPDELPAGAGNTFDTQ